MSDETLDDVRRELLAQQGIDSQAARLVGGETLDEIEHNVDTFAKMVNSSGTYDTYDTHEPGRGGIDGHASRDSGTSHDTHDQNPSGDLFTNAARAKAVRKHALEAALVGRRSAQARDKQGRWTVSPSFDGGARAIVPAPRDAAQEHNELIGGLALRARLHRVDQGATAF